MHHEKRGTAIGEGRGEKPRGLAQLEPHPRNLPVIFSAYFSVSWVVFGFAGFFLLRDFGVEFTREVDGYAGIGLWRPGFLRSRAA